LALENFGRTAWNWLDAGQNIQGPIIAATVAILVFVLSRVVDLLLRRRDRYNIRRRLVVGLYAEVESNLEEIVQFVDNEDFLDVIVLKIRDSEMHRSSTHAETTLFRPLIVITESSRFFSASASLIPEIKNRALVPLMEFYRYLEELEDRRDAFESKAFETISLEGRIGTVYDLWNSASAAKTSGKHTLNVLAATYPDAWFRELKNSKQAIPKYEQRSMATAPLAPQNTNSG
jgi:hypothetical protein